jgi:hypothetical protein
MIDPFLLTVPALTHPPASAKSSRRSTNGMTDWREKPSPNNNNPIQTSAAANAFVQVIMMLRKTFIQHPVLMMELRPCRPIWQHSSFSDPAYLSFER